MVEVTPVPVEAGNIILNENSNRGQHSVHLIITTEKYGSLEITHVT